MNGKSLSFKAQTLSNAKKLKVEIDDPKDFVCEMYSWDSYVNPSTETVEIYVRHPGPLFEALLTTLQELGIVAERSHIYRESYADKTRWCSARMVGEEAKKLFSHVGCPIPSAAGFAATFLDL